MMRYLTVLILLIAAAVPGKIFATPVRVTDGQIQFAIATFGGDPIWTSADRATALLNQTTTTVIDVTPQQFEINLSTCLVVNIGGVTIGFQGYEDWMSCQTRAGLKKKIMSIRSLINSMSDFPVSDYADLVQRAGWLKSYYQSLP